jgi:hypothetical protein
VGSLEQASLYLHPPAAAETWSTVSRSSFKVRRESKEVALTGGLFPIEAVPMFKLYAQRQAGSALPACRFEIYEYCEYRLSGGRANMAISTNGKSLNAQAAATVHLG